MRKPLDPDSDLVLSPTLAAALRALLPAVAEHTVAAVVVEVPGYTGSFGAEMGAQISEAVRTALLGFLELASRHRDPGTPLAPTLDAAYSLGRGEARSGRSVDALLTAYRVGARVAWRELAAAAAAHQMQVVPMARFADLMFAYIDELSAASVAGHTDELSTTGRVRERHLEHLCQHLLAGADADVLTASAARADWPVPVGLTAVLLPLDQVRAAIALLPAATLQPREELPGLADCPETVSLLVPGPVGPGRPDDGGGPARRRLLRILADRQAVVGPTRPWMQVRSSYLRAVRTARLTAESAHPADVTGRASRLARAGSTAPVDTDAHLVDLVLSADPEALADLRTRALAPLAGLSPATAERLTRTLRAWLLHQGRRDEVAAELFVHAQTVRYRMGQLRELYGDRLHDPQTVLELTLALG